MGVSNPWVGNAHLQQNPISDSYMKHYFWKYMKEMDTLVKICSVILTGEPA